MSLPLSLALSRFSFPTCPLSVVTDCSSWPYRYIEFYLDLVMAKENVSLLYALAGKVKTVRDVETAYSKNLYTVSELAQHIIQARTRQHSWTIESYPGKISMPRDLFQSMKTPEDVQKVSHCLRCGNVRDLFADPSCSAVFVSRRRT